MLKIGEIVKIMEEFAPLELQAGYDNCGLFYGDLEWPLRGVLVTLDTSIEVVNEAIKLGANMIVEHHPSVFMPIKKIDLNYPKHKAIALAIKNDIAIYSAHTCVDFTEGGLNDRFMEMLGCSSYEPRLGLNSEMRIGKLSKKMTLSELVGLLGELFDDKHISFVGDPNYIIETIGVINGGGGSHEGALFDAKYSGADVFISGDFKYNVFRLAKDMEYPIISLGHYNSEMPFINLIKELLISKNIGNVHGSSTCTNPLN